MGEITTVVTYIQDIIDAINTNGASLLTSRSGIVQQLVTKLDAFFNETYLANLNIFQTIKDQVQAKNINNSALIQALVSDGVKIVGEYVVNCTGLKNSNLERLFSEQMAKMGPLFTLYDFVDSKVLGIKTNLTTFRTALQNNYRLNFQTFWDEFNKMPLGVVDQAKTLIDTSVAQTKTEFDTFKTTLETTISTKVDEVLSSTVSKVLLDISDYSTRFPALIQ